MQDDLNRREFVAGAGATALVGALGTGVHGESQSRKRPPGPNDRPRLAQIGCGSIGRHNANIVLDLGLYERPASPVVRRLYDDGRTNILFVGRIIPNKRIEDLVRVFAAYQRWVDPRSRLLLVGDHRGFERYFDRLRELVSELRLDEVVFTGQVDDDELYAHYREADRLSSRDGKPVAYHVIQWLSAQALQQLVEARDKREMPVDSATRNSLDQHCAVLIELAAEGEARSPDFWNTAVRTDCAVLKALAGLQFQERADDIVKGYVDAVTRGGSPRELLSVIEHLAFLRDMLAAKAGESGRATRSLLDDQVLAIGGIAQRLQARL